MENNMSKIKNVARMMHGTILERNISGIHRIESALNQMLEVDFDPQSSVSKLYSYIADFNEKLEQADELKDSTISSAAWKALELVVYNLLTSDVEGWKWYEKFEFYYRISHRNILEAETKADEKKAAAHKAEVIKDAFASLGL